MRYVQTLVSLILVVALVGCGGDSSPVAETGPSPDPSAGTTTSTVSTTASGSTTTSGTPTTSGSTPPAGTTSGTTTSTPSTGSTASPAAPTLTTRTLATGASDLTLPLTNARGVVLADVPVSLHSESNRLYATRWEDNGQTVKFQLSSASNAGGATLAHRGNHLLAVYVENVPQRRLKARESTDGGHSWSDPVDLGAAPAGPALPTACIWQYRGGLRRAVAWSDQPSQSQGPLVTVVHNGGAWLTPVSDANAPSSGAAMACSDDELPELVWRDHRHGQGGVAIYHARLDPDTGVTQAARPIVQPGYDPSLCRIGSKRFVGFHTGTNDAHLAYSDATWQTISEVDWDAASNGTQLDDSGKFVSVACAGNTVAATWGDWPNKNDATQHLDATRKLAMIVSRDGGATWQALQPAGTNSGQLVATVAVRDDRVAVVWRSTDSVLHLATYLWP